MYETYEMGLWRQHQEDLLREAEHGRLVRQLRATRRRRTTRLWEVLHRRFPGRTADGLPATARGAKREEPRTKTTESARRPLVATAQGPAKER